MEQPDGNLQSDMCSSNAGIRLTNCGPTAALDLTRFQSFQCIHTAHLCSSLVSQLKLFSSAPSPGPWQPWQSAFSKHLPEGSPSTHVLGLDHLPPGFIRTAEAMGRFTQAPMHLPVGLSALGPMSALGTMAGGWGERVSSTGPSGGLCPEPPTCRQSVVLRFKVGEGTEHRKVQGQMNFPSHPSPTGCQPQNGLDEEHCAGHQCHQKCEEPRRFPIRPKGDPYQHCHGESGVKPPPSELAQAGPWAAWLFLPEQGLPRALEGI